MGALSEMRMLTQKSETHCSGLEYGALLVQLLVFLDTHVSLAPTHVCLSVRWSVTLSDFQSVSVSGRPA